MSSIEDLLRGGDPRTLKGVTRVIGDVLHDPSRVEQLVNAMSHRDATVRMRAADAAEKISGTNPELLEPFRTTLLQTAATTTQPSLRWHLAQIVPRLRLGADERNVAVAILKRFLDDSSALVKTCAMQGLADLALSDARLRRTIVPALRNSTEMGTAAMRARGTRLLRALERRRSANGFRQ